MRLYRSDAMLFPRARFPIPLVHCLRTGSSEGSRRAYRWTKTKRRKWPPNWVVMRPR
jgi:hypothetical protein